MLILSFSSFPLSCFQVTALSARATRWLSSWELVPLVYGALPLAVRVSAHGNLLHHLHKLHAEGRVRQAGCPLGPLDLWGWLGGEKQE